VTSRYAEVYGAWRADPEGFWAEAAGAIDWFKPWDRVFDPDQGVYGRWFVGAETNMCHNCLDRHVERGRPGQAAIVYDSPVTGTRRTLTYADLLAEVNALAHVLRSLGVERGDRVVIYMPMVPEAVAAMLACTRLGAVHCVVFGGFASNELAVRIDDAEPKLVISASCGIEPSRVVPYKPLLDRALELARHRIGTTLILQREEAPCALVEGRDHDYEALVGEARRRGETVPPVAVAAIDPLYILHTSGTTGQPKGVLRDTGGHMVSLAWSMGNVYGIDPGEVFWAASDIGWVVGHSYIVYAPLLHGCTTVLYEGKPVGTPDAGAYWRVIEEHGVAALFTAPTAFRAIKKEDPEGAEIAKYDLGGFRMLFLAGERADPDTIRWAEAKLGVPVVDHWWQTETGWAIVANPAGLGLLPVKYGSPTVAMPGWDLGVLDDQGNELPHGSFGNIVAKLPLPPGSLVTLWRADERFRAAYLEDFPGYYRTADAGLIDEDGYVYVMSRTDDIINVAGHRLSTGAIEEVIAGHEDVAECAVVGAADGLKGQVPVGFVVLKAGRRREDAAIEAECVAKVRAEIGPVAALRTVRVVKRLPKTRSGKVLRATMRQIADGEAPKVPPTIDDPAILDEIREALGR